MARVKRPVTIRDLVVKTNNSNISSLGGIVAKINEIIRNPNAQASDLMTVIETDPPLCAKVLRRANSAVYALRQEVKSIRHAIVILGFNTVRELALNLKVGEVFDNGVVHKKYERRELWKHSLAVAMTAKNILQMELKAQGDDIYPVALLHDIGSIVLDEFEPDKFTEVLDIYEQDNTLMEWDIEKKIFGFDHSAVGQALLKEWKLPFDFVDAVAYHHKPFLSKVPNSKTPYILFIADYLCHNTGPQFFSYNDVHHKFEQALEKLGLEEKAIRLIAEDTWQAVYKLEEEGLLF